MAKLASVSFSIHPTTLGAVASVGFAAGKVSKGSRGPRRARRASERGSNCSESRVLGWSQPQERRRRAAF